MNNLTKSLLATIFALNSYAVIGAESTDDASKLGTADSPQIKRQIDRTDKGPTGVYQGESKDDASNLGNADSPQHKRQMERTNKGPSEPVEPSRKNKVLRDKNDNHGTTKGNPVQPSDPIQAPPTHNY